MTTSTVSPVQELYCVVHHNCYAPQGHRVYRSDDQYLEDYPSMGTILDAYASMEEAQAAADGLNAQEWEEYCESYVDYTA